MWKRRVIQCWLRFDKHTKWGLLGRQIHSLTKLLAVKKKIKQQESFFFFQRRKAFPRKQLLALIVNIYASHSFLTAYTHLVSLTVTINFAFNPLDCTLYPNLSGHYSVNFHFNLDLVFSEKGTKLLVCLSRLVFSVWSKSYRFLRKLTSLLLCGHKG